MRVLLADNHKALCDTLAQYLQLKADELFQRPITFTPVFTLADAIVRVQSGDDERPDLVFLDLGFEQENFDGVATVQHFQNENKHKIPVVVYTGRDIYNKEDVEIFRSCISDHGILGVLLKSADTLKLCQAIRTLIDGDSFYPPELTKAIAIPVSAKPSLSKEDRWGLTDREWEIAQLMCTGLKTYSIALELGIAESWCAQRLCMIYRKLGVHSRLTAVNMVRDRLRELELTN